MKQKLIMIRYLVITFFLVALMFADQQSTPANAATIKKPVIQTKKSTVTTTTLNWKKVPNVAGYRVYRFNTTTGLYQRIATTKKTTFKDTKRKANTTYYYRVRAYQRVNGKNIFGKYSKVCKIKTTKSKSYVLSEQAKEMITALNKLRTDHNLTTLELSTDLTKIADLRAIELVEKFSHTRPNGSSCFTILKENSVTYSIAAENLAKGYTNVDDVLKGWYESDGHRENLLHESVRKVGIGYYTNPADGITYWVQIFTN